MHRGWGGEEREGGDGTEVFWWSTRFSGVSGARNRVGGGRKGRREGRSLKRKGPGCLATTCYRGFLSLAEFPLLVKGRHDRTVCPKWSPRRGSIDRRMRQRHLFRVLDNGTLLRGHPSHACCAEEMTGMLNAKAKSCNSLTLSMYRGGYRWN